MKKDEAIKEANDWYDNTKEHAFVVETDDGYQWYGQAYFQLGGNYGHIIYGTNW